jgi:hypothetical protein
MERNLDAALEREDLPRLALGLERVPDFVPTEAWNAGAQGWTTIARAGGAAARAGDLLGAKASCKSCHKTWRKRYRDEFRPRPIAGSM